MEPVRLRPLSVGEILDAAIKIYRARFATLVKVVFVVVAPVQVVSAIVQISVPSESITSTDQFGNTEFDAAALIGTLVALFGTAVLGWLAGQLATATSLKVVSDAYLNEERDWTDSLRFAKDHLLSLVWLAFLIGLLGILGFLACVIPGVYFYVAWSVAVPVLLLENERGFKAMRRSRQLVKGFWWRVFGCLIVAAILGSVVAGVFQGVLVGFTFNSDSELVRVIAAAIAGIASSVLVTPFSAAVNAVLYFDLRVRKEGFDLELLARSVGVEPPVGLSSPQSWGQDEPPPGSPGAGGEQPPFWPPPPGWRPSGG
jgi:hypothetical protein